MRARFTPFQSFSQYLKWQRQQSFFSDLSRRLRYFLLSLRARLQDRNTVIASEPVDILFLRRSPKTLAFDDVVRYLPDDVRACSIFVPKPGQMLTGKMLVRAALKHTSFHFYILASFVQYLLATYQPRIIVTESNGSELSPVLRTMANLRGVKIVHIAHSIPTANYRKFSLVDYDYYFVYGKSSVDYLKQRAFLFGRESCCVETGARAVFSRLLLPDSERCISDKTLLLLGSGPGHEAGEATQKVYQAAIEFVRARPGLRLLFKPHPRSDRKLWQQLSSGCDKNQLQLVDSLEQGQNAAVAICGYTNAMLDVSVLGIVPLLISPLEQEDYFSYEAYLGPMLTELTQLSARYDAIISELSFYQQRTAAFAAYHVGDIQNPSATIADSLHSILRQQPPSGEFI